METEIIKQLRPKCSVCFQNYLSQKGAIRPNILPCGHGICSNCLKLAGAGGGPTLCHICRSHYDKSRVVINYELEEQIENVVKQEVIFKNSRRCTYLCTDCRMTFVHSEYHLLSSVHASHKTITLEKLSEKQLHRVIWLTDVLGDSKNSIPRMKKLFQMILSLAHQYQTELAEIEASYRSDPLNWPQKVWKEFMPAFTSGKLETSDLNQLPFSLFKLRDIQESFGHGIISCYLSDLGRAEIERLETIEKEAAKKAAEQMSFKDLPIPSEAKLEEYLSENERLEKIQDVLASFHSEVSAGIRLLPSIKLAGLIDDLSFILVPLPDKGSMDLETQPTKLCLSCKVLFHSSKQITSENEHADHMQMQVNPIADTFKKDIAWVSEFISKPLEVFGRMRKFLQIILTVAAQYQSVLKSCEDAYEHKSSDWAESMLSQCLMRKILVNYKPPDLTKNLMLLRDLHSSFGYTLIENNLSLLISSGPNPETIKEAEKAFQSEKNLELHRFPGPSMFDMLKELDMKVVPMNAEDLGDQLPAVR